MVQWLRLCASTAGSVSSIPSQGSKDTTSPAGVAKKTIHLRRDLELGILGLGETASQYPGFDWAALHLLSILTLCIVTGEPVKGQQAPHPHSTVPKAKGFRKAKERKEIPIYSSKKRVKSFFKIL